MSQAQSGRVGKQTPPPPHHIVCLDCWERSNWALKVTIREGIRQCTTQRKWHNDRLEVFGICDSLVWLRPWVLAQGRK